MTYRTRDELEPLDHYVYVMWRDAAAVYVGMTHDYDKRLAQHESNRKHMRWTHVDAWEVGPGRTNAERIETETIRVLDPEYNRQHSPRVERDKQAWHDYCEWADALRLSDTFPDREWAVDQALADRLCAAVGRTAPDVHAYVEANRAYTQAVINSLPDVTQPKAAVA